jgi:hypothetical protein
VLEAQGHNGLQHFKQKERKMKKKRIKKFGAITVQNQLRLLSQNLVFKVRWLGPVNVGGAGGYDGVNSFTDVIGHCLRLLLYTV